LRISLRHPASVAFAAITKVCLASTTRLERIAETVLPEPTPDQLPTRLFVLTSNAARRCIMFGWVGTPLAVNAHPSGT
jgi:hypothetical protein